MSSNCEPQGPSYPATPRLIDSHCHIDHQAFHDLASTLKACAKQGITDLVVPGLNVQQWQSLIGIHQRHNNLHIAFGCHPWWITPDANLKVFADTLAEYANKKCCIAIGETGIDGLKSIDLGVQQKWFEQHIKIARAANKPLIIHAVKAHPQIQQTLAQYKGKVRGVIHGFSGSAELANHYWRLGFHLGIGGTITYPRGTKAQQAVKELPLEAILLETDAPDMPLHGLQGKPNHPTKIWDIARRVANLRGQPLEEIAAVTTKNCFDLFGIQ